MIKIKDFNFLEGLRPKKMFEELSKTVIDQEAAINKLSVSIYNHYNRLLIRENEKLKKSKESILRDFEIRFKYENCDFKVSHHALLKISETAMENKTGARGLNKVFYDLFSDVLTECINDKDLKKKIYVNKEDIINNKIKVNYENIWKI